MEVSALRRLFHKAFVQLGRFYLNQFIVEFYNVAEVLGEPLIHFCYI